MFNNESSFRQIKRACLYIESEIFGTRNKPFEDTPIGQGMKSVLYPYVVLKRELEKYNIIISTKDIISPLDADILIFVDTPHHFVSKKNNSQILCLFIYDPPIYAPESWNKSYHTKFDLIFTFDQTLVDNIKYFYYPFAIDTNFFILPTLVTEAEYNSRKLATFVSNSIHKVKDKKNPDSLIHKRYETIKWFSINYPDEFDFYGGSFEERVYFFGFRGASFLKKVVSENIFRKIAKVCQKKIIKLYKGKLGPLEKFEVIKKYNFYYCYENTQGINGYITEKIFDCLYSSVVPIYWGAPNIDDLIPFKCYINGNDFASQEELYKFISTMPYSIYLEYIKQAHFFLESESLKRFTVENFVQCVINGLKQKSVI